MSKSKPEYMTSLRSKWKAAKDKHAVALTAKKITFTQGLGRMMEKRLPLYKAVSSFKAGDSILVVRVQLNSIKSNGKDILAAANAYIAKVHGVGNPAEAELTAILRTIAKEAGQYDIDFVTQKIENAVAATAKAKEKAKVDAERKKRIKAASK